MAKIKNYNGSVNLIAGITQKGDGDFALVEANAVQTREDGTRLDTELEEIKNNKIDKISLIEATAEDIDNWIGTSDTTSVVGEATAGNAIVGM